MASVAQQDANPSMSSVTHLSLTAEGMTCASCVGRVERALDGRSYYADLYGTRNAI